MKIGFTGTQHGLTDIQKLAVAKLFEVLDDREDDNMVEFHQGDCVGGDIQANAIVLGNNRYNGCKRVGHPPLDEKKRAWTSVDEWRKPAYYIDRNHNIVNETDVLIGCPKTMNEEIRSGTWATIRYARAKGRETFIVWPDGTVAHTEKNEELMEW